MKFCKLFRLFNHSLQNQKRSNSHVYVTRSHRSCSVKKVFLKISQISQENTRVGVFFYYFCKPFQECKFIKTKRDSNTAFFVKFVKFSRTAILKNICERLLLNFYFGKNFYLAKYNEWGWTSRPKLFCENVVFINSTKFTLKKLCRSLVFKRSSSPQGD